MVAQAGEWSCLSKPKAKKARKRFEKVLKALQDALGKLNDISVHEGLAKQFAHPDKRSKKIPEKAYAIGLFTGREKHIALTRSAGWESAEQRPESDKQAAPAWQDASSHGRNTEYQVA
jgi:hypothetical protein